MASAFDIVVVVVLTRVILVLLWGPRALGVLPAQLAEFSKNIQLGVRTTLSRCTFLRLVYYALFIHN